MNKYRIDISKITHIDLWGQEPTLTLDAFNTQLTKILDWLTQSCHLFFSTNGMSYPERIINLIEILNKYLTKNKNRFFELQIQFSFDGIKYTNEARGGNAEKIINNIKEIIKKVDTMKIVPNLRIQFDLHGVMTMAVIKDSLECGDVTAYWIENDRILKEMSDLNTKRQIGLTRALYSNFQQPCYNTSEDGRLAAEYCRKCLEANPSFTYGALGILSPMAHAANSMFQPKQDGEKYRKLRDLQDDIKTVYNFEYDKDIPTFNYLIGDFYGCGVGKWNLKMRYDGTLLFCQNSFYSIKKENLENKKGITYDVQRFELEHPGFQPNLITSSKKDVENFINIFDVAKHYGHQFEFSTIVNLMYFLSKNNQIDESYKTESEKLLRHAMMLSNFIMCFYNNVIETGSLYNFTVGTIRFYCNGILDIVEDYVNKWEYFGPWR